MTASKDRYQEDRSCAVPSWQGWCNWQEAGQGGRYPPPLTLPSAALLEDGDNLWQLGSNSEDTGSSLQVLQRGFAGDAVIVQSIACSSQASNENGRGSLQAPAAVPLNDALRVSPGEP